MEKFPQCAICGTTQQLLRCAKCKTIFYCSIAHQHMDWPTHKQSCRMLAKQKNNNRIQHLQQAVAATTLNTPTLPNMSSDIDAGNHHWSTTMNGVGIIGFGLIDGSESAEVDPSILTAVPPMAVMGGNRNESGSINDSSNISANDGYEAIYKQISDTGGTVTSTSVIHNMSAATTSCMQPQYHHVDQRLLSPQYHQQQQQLRQKQLQLQHMSPTQAPYSPTSNLSNHNTHHQYEKSFSCQIGSGGGVDENAFGNANERRYDELCRNIIKDMNEYGLSVVDDFLGVEKGLQILNEVHHMYAAGVFKDGQLVNNLREEELRTIRGDKITWVKGQEPGCENVGYLINQIDAVICRANIMKNNGLLGNYNIKERTKAMVACYPGSGSHYVVHVDNPNKDGRVITAIYYLNVNWDTARSGGVLRIFPSPFRIFPEHGNTIADIDPKFDRLIFFWSDRRNPHEVQPSHRTRYAITVWYFDANEREEALNRIKNNKNNAKIPTNTTSKNANSTTRATAPTNMHGNSNNTNTNTQSHTTNTTSAHSVTTTTTSSSLTAINTNIPANANSNAIINNSKRASIKNSTAAVTEHTNSSNTTNISNNAALANSSEICT
ncbi:hypoxia-inducible factor prolyl hydroxylase isoform X1 [Anastrepha ludens]|uniref:hypoxia-inducible factor prolyl hydroxylase isoform X1 n=1 Tax=Anastrepha ludens TaxID=28586 RepID=UPI0023B0E42C|nr:hypoxia-inducible factor prolyl hydroxylase isoform X1 [Anastrepha ludens]XP_053969747.1 hypoxia-inducible factor prolyl hydroxylase isoform X1 [Anastrepha ludens]